MPVQVAIVDSNDVSSVGVSQVFRSDDRFNLVRVRMMHGALRANGMKPGDILIADPFDKSRPDLNSTIWGALRDYAAHGLNVIVYTDELRPETLLDGMVSGFKGYLIKSYTSASRLVEAAIAVSQHSLLAVDQRVLDFFSEEWPGRIVAFVLPGGPPTVSNRERDILSLLAEGRSDQEYCAPQIHRRQHRRDSRQQHLQEAPSREPVRMRHQRRPVRLDPARDDRSPSRTIPSI